MPSRSASRPAVSKNSAAGELHQKLSEVIDELVASGISLEQARDEFERQYVVTALAATRGGVGRSAEMLGIHRNTLRNKVCALGIKPRDYAPPRPN